MAEHTVWLDTYIAVLKKMYEIHGNLAVCMSDGKSDMLWDAHYPSLGTDYSEDGVERIIVISPKR